MTGTFAMCSSLVVLAVALPATPICAGHPQGTGTRFNYRPNFYQPEYYRPNYYRPNYYRPNYSRQYYRADPYRYRGDYYESRYSSMYPLPTGRLLPRVYVPFWWDWVLWRGYRSSALDVPARPATPPGGAVDRRALRGRFSDGTLPDRFGGGL